ncbi:MAG: MATE family efflux transporter [Acidobacteriota bacterium]
MSLDKSIPPEPEEDQAPFRPSQLWREVRTALAGHPQDYTRSHIGRAILLLAVPMVLEMSMQSVFGVVDVFFVGRLGAAAVAVVGMTDSLLTLIFAVAMGLSMATTAMVARRIGEKNPEAASNVAVQSIGVGVSLSLITGLCGVVLAGDLLGLIGASRPIMEVGSRFTAIMLGGNITVMLLFLINAVFRGAGDAFIAMRALWLANLINIVLDPLLIFGLGPFPELGLEGAAIATNIGRGVGVLYQLSRLRHGNGRIGVKLEGLRIDPFVIRRLLRISVVGMLQFLIGTASWLGVMRILAVFGGATLAGYTIAVRIIIFALLPSWGMGNAAATLVGQNLGAGKPDRAERSVWITGVSNMVFLGTIAVVFILFAQPLVRIFSSNAEVVAMGVDCLQIVSYSYVFMAFGMVTVQAFNGAGDTTTPTWINLFCYWFLQIPMAYLLAIPLELGPRGVFAAIAVAQSALALVSLFLFRRGGWKRRSV